MEGGDSDGSDEQAHHANALSVHSDQRSGRDYAEAQFADVEQDNDLSWLVSHLQPDSLTQESEETTRVVEPGLL